MGIFLNTCYKIILFPIVSIYLKAALTIIIFTWIIDLKKKIIIQIFH